MVNTVNSKFNWLKVTWPSLCLFFALGLNIGSWASRLSDIKASMGISDLQLGFLLLAPSLGAICAFPLTVWLLRNFGARRMSILLGGGAALLLPAIMINTHYHLGLIIMFIEGGCCAGLNAAINTYGSDIERKYNIKCMSRLHAVFSLGLAIAAMVSIGLIRFASTELSVHGLLIGVLLFSLFFLSFRFSKSNKASKKETQKSEPKLINITTMMFGITVLCATVIEGSMNDWSTIYLRDIIEVSSALAPSGVLVFSLAMFVGRLFAALLQH